MLQVMQETGLAEFGHEELTLAEHEMPGLMHRRKEFGSSQPFKGLNINESLHATIQTYVLIETLAARGAQSVGAPATFSALRTTQLQRLPRLAQRQPLRGRARRLLR